MDFSLLGFSGFKDVFNIHPVFVHFPIALFPTALLFFILGRVTGNKPFDLSGRVCLWLATAGSVIAVVTGLIAEDSIPHNDVIHNIMQTHMIIGYWIVGLGITLSGWSFWHEDHRPRGFWPFIGLLVIANTLVLQNGDLGGRMVFIEGAAVKPAVSTITSGSIEKEPEIEHHEHSSHQHAH